MISYRGAPPAELIQRARPVALRPRPVTFCGTTESSSIIYRNRKASAGSARAPWRAGT